MDPGRDPTAGFSGLIAIGAVNGIGVLSNPDLISGADLGGFIGFERTPIFARFIRLTVPLLLPLYCPVLVTRSANVFRAFHFKRHAVKQFF